MADLDVTARAMSELCVRLPARNRLLALGELVDVLCATDPAQCMSWFLQVVDAANGDRLAVRHANGHTVKPGAADRYFLVRDVGAWLQAEGWAVTFADGENAAAPDQTDSACAVASAPAAHVKGRRWTPEEIEAARVMRDRFRGDGARDYAHRAAKHFGITTEQLRKTLASKNESRSTLESAWSGLKPLPRKSESG